MNSSRGQEWKPSIIPNSLKQREYKVSARPGRLNRLSDSKVITIAIAGAVWIVTTVFMVQFFNIHR